MSKELRIGIFAAISLVMFIWGLNFLKGFNLFNQADTYKVEYENVDYLSKSSPVLLNGYPTGLVTDIEIVEGSMNKMLVTFTMDKSDIKLPKHTVAVIVDQSLMGGKAVELHTDIPCDEKFQCDSREGYLRGYSETLLESLIGTPDDVDQFLQNVNKNLGPILDTLKGELKGDPEGEGLNRTMYDLSQTARNLNAVTYNLNNMIQSTSGSFGQVTDNLAGITGTINDNNTDIATMMNNMSAFSESLNQVDLDKTAEQINNSLAQLEATLTETQSLMNGINEVIQKVENGEGTLGKLLSDEELYREFHTLAIHLDTLVSDFQTRPYRYIPLKNRNRVLRYDERDAK